MKKIIVLLTLIAVSSVWAGSGKVNTGQNAGSVKPEELLKDLEMPKEVMVGISDVFVPSGFDSNSDAYVVVSGMFPNGCYRWSKAEVEHKAKGVHEVRSYAFVQPGMCLMVLVPFTKEVQLGVLESGTHKVRFVNGDGTYLERVLVVE